MIRFVLFHHPTCHSLHPLLLIEFLDGENKAVVVAVVDPESSLDSTPVESTGFRIAAVQYLLAKLNGNAPKAELAAVYLRGEPHSGQDLKEIGVFEKLDKANGFRFLRSMCQLLQRAELAAGTALLFDEARRSLSLMSSRAQTIACENLLTVPTSTAARIARRAIESLRVGLPNGKPLNGHCHRLEGLLEPCGG